MKIFVGNLPYNTDDNELRTMFEPFGEVLNVEVIRDRLSGESRGFGFVEMPVKNEAVAAIRALSEKEVDGRALQVNEARPRPSAGPGRSGGGRRHDSRRRGGGSRKGGRRRGGW